MTRNCKRATDSSSQKISEHFERTLSCKKFRLKPSDLTTNLIKLKIRSDHKWSTICQHILLDYFLYFFILVAETFTYKVQRRINICTMTRL